MLIRRRSFIGSGVALAMSSPFMWLREKKEKPLKVFTCTDDSQLIFILYANSSTYGLTFEECDWYKFTVEDQPKMFPVGTIGLGQRLARFRDSETLFSSPVDRIEVLPMEDRADEPAKCSVYKDRAEINRWYTGFEPTGKGMEARKIVIYFNKGSRG